VGCGGVGGGVGGVRLLNEAFDFIAANSTQDSRKNSVQIVAPYPGCGKE
jgi:hypothetical protein